MVRVKRGKLKTKKRKKLLKETKGYKWGRKSKKKMAREAFWHAMVHAYRGRKEKKRLQRRIWNIKINAALRAYGYKYSEFLHKMKEKNIKINRKMLAELAQNYSDVFNKLIKVIEG